jgi:hypothetical protein
MEVGYDEASNLDSLLLVVWWFGVPISATTESQVIKKTKRGEICIEASPWMQFINCSRSKNTRLCYVGM